MRFSPVTDAPIPTREYVNADWDFRIVHYYLPAHLAAGYTGAEPLTPDLWDAMTLAGLDPRSERCTHEYDCCGRWYTSGAYLRGVVRGVAVVEQSWHRNV